jgi:hypothetical protein
MLSSEYDCSASSEEIAGEEESKMWSMDEEGQCSFSSPIVDNKNRNDITSIYTFDSIDIHEIDSDRDRQANRKWQSNNYPVERRLNNTIPERGKDYATLAMKPAVFSELRRITDRYYPGIFLPSALIIMMNEVKRGDYFVDAHRINMNLSGRYSSLTIRSDVKAWLKENYNRLNEEYMQKYGVKNFSRFVTIFLLNLIQSKIKTQENIVRLKQSDFDWLVDVYKKRQNNKYYMLHSAFSFEQFADIFFKELYDRLNSARAILNV